MRTGAGIVVGQVAVAVLVVLCGTAGVASAGRGAFIPPVRIELGHAVTGTREGPPLEATQLAVGLSWASLYPKPTPVDFGVGFIATFAPEPDTVAKAREVGPVDDDHDAAGAYVDLAVRGAAGRHWRTWVGARGELMDQGEVSTLGAAARASIELWTGAMGIERGGAIIGTVAVSAWAETGLREQVRGGAASFVAAGLGMRLPLIVAGN
jgi:hypothetical protein